MRRLMEYFDYFRQVWALFLSISPAGTHLAGR
jgi:hypothetical protein